MQEDWGGRERRQSARVDAQVALQLSGAEEGFPVESLTTESINVGAEGVYCHVGHFIAPLTKLQVTMVLPLRDRKGQTKNEVVKTQAVVVRCQPAGSEQGGYRIACFFTGLDAATRGVLEEYVDQHYPGP
ncbi:MAG: PilZ domain-containing protein [Candidatus Eisenbacteria bacterium]